MARYATNSREGVLWRLALEQLQKLSKRAAMDLVRELKRLDLSDAADTVFREADWADDQAVGVVVEAVLKRIPNRQRSALEILLAEYRVRFQLVVAAVKAYDELVQ